MTEPENEEHARATRELAELSRAMYAVIERRAGREGLQAVIMLDDPDAAGFDSIAVFGYPACGSPAVHVVENVATHLAEFGESFGLHVDIYVNGTRLTKGPASPNAS